MIIVSNCKISCNIVWIQKKDIAEGWSKPPYLSLPKIIEFCHFSLFLGLLEKYHKLQCLWIALYYICIWRRNLSTFCAACLSFASNIHRSLMIYSNLNMGWSFICTLISIFVTWEIYKGCKYHQKCRQFLNDWVGFALSS